MMKFPSGAEAVEQVSLRLPSMLPLPTQSKQILLLQLQITAVGVGVGVGGVVDVDVVDDDDGVAHVVGAVTAAVDVVAAVAVAALADCYRHRG